MQTNTTLPNENLDQAPEQIVSTPVKKSKLKKVENALFADANMVNTYGAVYGALAISNGWPKAPAHLINDISLNSGLGLMVVSLADGLLDLMEVKKLNALRKDYKSALSSTSTFVFSLRAILAGWVYIASDYGKDSNDVYISDKKFFSLVAATGTISLLKFIYEVLENHALLDEKEQEYKSHLSMLNAIYEGNVDSENENESSETNKYIQGLENQIASLNRKLAIVEKLKSSRPILNFVFSGVSAAGNITSLLEASTHLIFKTELKKHYTLQGMGYLASVFGGTGLSALFRNNPQQMARLLTYISAILLMINLIQSYMGLAENPETKVNANVLVGLWGMLLAIPFATLGIKACSKNQISDVADRDLEGARLYEEDSESDSETEARRPLLKDVKEKAKSKAEITTKNDENTTGSPSSSRQFNLFGPQNNDRKEIIPYQHLRREFF